MKRLVVLLLLALASLAVRAQAYPGARPITLVVAFAAGGPVDRLAHDLAEALSRSLGGATIVIENIAGAGGTIAAAKVARARPDGYTLFLHHVGMATTPALHRKLSFDVLRDFEYLGMISEVPMTLVARPSLQARSFAELRQWMADNRGRIMLGNAGLGAASHLCGLMLQSLLQINMTTVPYRGTAPALADLIRGQIDLLCDQSTNTSGQIAAGRVKAYAVTSARRLATPALKDLPTLQELGFKDFELTIWNALYAPRGLTAERVARINAALQATLKDPVFVRKQQALGAVVIEDGRQQPAAHRRFVQRQIEILGAVISAAGVYAE